MDRLYLATDCLGCAGHPVAVVVEKKHEGKGKFRRKPAAPRACPCPQVPDIAEGPRLGRVPDRLVSRQPLAGERQQRQHPQGLGCQNKETGH